MAAHAYFLSVDASAHALAPTRVEDVRVLTTEEARAARPIALIIATPKLTSRIDLDPVYALARKTAAQLGANGIADVRVVGDTVHATAFRTGDDRPLAPAHDMALRVGGEPAAKVIALIGVCDDVSPEEAGRRLGELARKVGANAVIRLELDLANRNACPRNAVGHWAVYSLTGLAVSESR